MRVWVILFILLLNIVLQSSFFPFIEIYGAEPDSLMILVVSFALLAGSPTASIVGFCGGLLQDILFGEALGIYALLYMLIGYAIGLVHQKIYVGRIIFPIFFVVIGIIAKEFILLVYIFFMRIEIPFEQLIFRIVIPEAVYTAILMPFVYYLMERLYQFKFMTKKWRFK